MKIRKRLVMSTYSLCFCLLPHYRYSEFEDLHQKLIKTFPHAVGSMPQFPPKSVVCKCSTLRPATSPHSMLTRTA
jgi:hypothetical protein